MYHILFITCRCPLSLVLCHIYFVNCFLQPVLSPVSSITCPLFSNVCQTFLCHSSSFTDIITCHLFSVACLQLRITSDISDPCKLSSVHCSGCGHHNPLFPHFFHLSFVTHPFSFVLCQLGFLLLTLFRLWSSRSSVSSSLSWSPAWYMSTTSTVLFSSKTTRCVNKPCFAIHAVSFLLQKGVN